MNETTAIRAIKPAWLKTSVSRKVFVLLNNIFLLALAVLCVFPFVNLLAVSLSESNAVASGIVTFFPVDFTLNAYEYLLNKISFFNAFGMSVLRVVLGTVISLAVMILLAYPLSLAKGKFHGRKFYVSICIISMFFSGGLIPTFVVVKSLGLYNSIFALILPTAMNCWEMVLLINFFRRVPVELTEYASIEGAGHFVIMSRVVLPLSLSALATVILFTAVGHWNAWFDGYIYMSSEKYPLQTYIYNLLDTLKTLQSNNNKTPEDLALLATLGDSTVRSAQVFIAMVPIMLVYPFAQKYFVKGLLLGSVKE
ncbi:MAG: carbohydrate ABC transporter permease [Clostridiales bacterium]|nr:carbohydrate ABC transporter permease [Clostridiales bacterium]